MIVTGESRNSLRTISPSATLSTTNLTCVDLGLSSSSSVFCKFGQLKVVKRNGLEYCWVHRTTVYFENAAMDMQLSILHFLILGRHLNILCRTLPAPGLWIARGFHSPRILALSHSCISASGQQQQQQQHSGCWPVLHKSANCYRPVYCVQITCVFVIWKFTCLYLYSLSPLLLRFLRGTINLFLSLQRPELFMA
jgi:hypothetical protein